MIVSNPKYCNCRAAIIPAIPAPITITRGLSFLAKNNFLNFYQNISSGNLLPSGLVNRLKTPKLIKP
jgi:hypothetical protein